MKSLLALVNSVNSYLSQNNEPRLYLVSSAAKYVTFIFKIFGLIPDDSIGYAVAESDNASKPVIDAFVSFRNNVRTAAREVPAVMKVCDSVRDEVLPPLGFRLTDGGPSGSTWSFDDPTVLIKEIAQKKEAELAKQRQKEKAAAEKLAKLEEGKTLPGDIFLSEKDKYSKFDDKGIPTHDAEGKEIGKGPMKKLKDRYEKQVKAHAAWLKHIATTQN